MSRPDMELDGVEHLLPPSARMFVGAIGLADTITLVRTMSGMKFRVPTRKRRAGEAKFWELADYIGVQAAEKLCKHFGGQTIEIPVCRTARAEIVHRAMRAEFDALTREHTGRYAINHLAVKYRKTFRHIRRILDTVDREADPETQLDLF